MLQPRCHRSPENDFKRLYVHLHVCVQYAHCVSVWVCVLGGISACIPCIYVSL